MDKKLFISRIDRTGQTFIVQRVIIAIETVAKAACCDPTSLPFGDDGIMHYPAIAKFMVELRELMAIAMKNEGSLTVRYLGDLKPSVYPIDTHFFHLKDSTEDGADFSRIMQKALFEGTHEELTFINLANVRDVKIHVGNHRALNISQDIKYLTMFCDVLEQWANDSASAKVMAE